MGFEPTASWSRTRRDTKLRYSPNLLGVKELQLILDTHDFPIVTALGYSTLSFMHLNNLWTRIKREHGLYRYNPSGQYFARVRFKGKLYRRRLSTDDLAYARRKLREFKNNLGRTDVTKGKTSFAKVLDDYAATLTGAQSTLNDKKSTIEKLKATWLGADTLPLCTVKPSQIAAWLSKHYGHFSASAYNSALTIIRAALDLAVRDRVVLESPAKDLKYKKRKQPIRRTPSFEQFEQIVAEIRSQHLNADAEQSGDFVEFLGLAGLGQAEAASIKRSDVDLPSGRIIVYRHKTDQGFVIPIYPQLRPLVEKLCAGKGHDEHLLEIKEARKALENACKRLGFRTSRIGRCEECSLLAQSSAVWM